ncbi:hypothetical protein RY26_13665 [Pseudomonas fluorescens]|nr:hypothetical protein RY26_13665 [Pseudomonas fluorescens]
MGDLVKAWMGQLYGLAGGGRKRGRFERCTARQDAIAGKPAPTGFCVVYEMLVRLGHCGSGLARDAFG